MARKYKTVTSTTLQPATKNPLSFMSLNLVLTATCLLSAFAEFAWQQIQGAPVGMMANMLGLKHNFVLLGLLLGNPRVRRHVGRRVGRWWRGEVAGSELGRQRRGPGGGGTVHSGGVREAWM